jgi:hypothetical protein
VDDDAAIVEAIAAISESLPRPPAFPSNAISESTSAARSMHVPRRKSQADLQRSNCISMRLLRVDFDISVVDQAAI